jgi:general secretion pathway protein K
MIGRAPSRARLPTPPSKQRGVALLVAILLVALGTIIAATIGYESAMTARRGAATFAFDQGLLISQGAEAVAAYGLREIARGSGPNRTTNPTQAWAQPFGPVEIVPGVMLDARLEDLQGRFNLNSLVSADQATGNLTANPEARAAFEKLLVSLGIEPRWSGYVIDWIDPDIQPQTPEGAEDSVYLGQTPPYLPPNKYITSTTELLALPGFGRERYEKLRPYITALPPEVKINVCTAPALVLDAFLPGTTEFGADPEGLAKNRASANGCYPKLAEYRTAYDQANRTSQATPPQPTVTPPGQRPGTSPVGPRSGLMLRFQETSNYFRLSSHIMIGNTEFNLYSLLYQDDQGAVRPILRSYTPD